MHTTSSGQGHETLLGTVIGEVLQVDPDAIRVTRPDSLNSLPSGTPVGSRMAIMLGGAAFHAAKRLKTKLRRPSARTISAFRSNAHFISTTPRVSDRDAPTAKTDMGRAGRDRGTAFSTAVPPIMNPACRRPHLQVPTGGTLPTADGRVQMYPCSSFEFHLILMSIDPELGLPEIVTYRVGHDCGTVINPKIVRGMTMGGIAHGIGAALYEEFAYDGEGQLMAQSFMDYLLPSSHEVPAVEIIHHVTPSPGYGAGPEGAGRVWLIGRRPRSPMPSTTRCARSAFPSTRCRSRCRCSATWIAEARANKGN